MNKKFIERVPFFKSFFTAADCLIEKMSTAMTFGQKQFIPTPPDKGSFPLDHDGVCKKSMTKYMKCLLNNNGNNSLCRDEAKDYLGCRMENNLMAKEDWAKLGFKTDVATEDKK